MAVLEDSSSYRELYSASSPVHIPRDAKMVACHFSGQEEAAEMFPQASIVTVSTDGEDRADVLDAGAVSIWDVRRWLKRKIVDGTYQPTVYCTKQRRRVLRVLTWRVRKDWWIVDRTGKEHVVSGAVAVQYARTKYFATSLVIDSQWPHREKPNPDAVPLVVEPPPPPQPRPRSRVAPKLLEDTMNLNHGKHAETVMAMPGGATGVRFSSAIHGVFLVDFGVGAARIVDVSFGDPKDIALPRDHQNKRVREVKVVRTSGDMDAEGSIAVI